ncbi:MAG: NAD(P)H-hydrate dehydratase [Firmicutes bacterium]|nr:NAD(P)H-hydrate dehydratase [Bacillota bacterium]
MKALTAMEMRELDRRCADDFGISGLMLMENAGVAVARQGARMLGNVQGRKIYVFAGTGNNGGDGFVAARHLSNWGARVRVFLAGEEESVKGDAATNLAILKRMGIDLMSADEGSLPRIRLAAGIADLTIDSILGTGARGEPRGLIPALIESMNQNSGPVLSVDLPSGLDADSGSTGAYCVRATATVTLGAPKLGTVLYPGASYTGDLYVADIGIPLSLPAQLSGVKLITGELVRGALRPRSPASHKGTFGHVLVVGGSRGMMGAPVLAARAALRIGAGLVTSAVPQSLQGVASAALTEGMTLGLPQGEDGWLKLASGEEVLAAAAKTSVLAVGPGLGRDPGAAAMVCSVVAAAPVPCVVDADGISALAERPELAEERRSGEVKCPLVLTPHPGEMARLLGTSVEEVQKDRLAAARTASQLWEATVILKGARSVVCSPTGDLHINLTGNPGMATAGSGDVLTGTVAGLVAQGLPPEEAGIAGAYLHGLAGDMAAGDRGEAGLLAGDIIEQLPQATRRTMRLEGDEEDPALMRARIKLLR